MIRGVNVNRVGGDISSGDHVKCALAAGWFAWTPRLGDSCRSGVR